MVHLLIGAFLAAGFLLIVVYTRGRKLHITWWQWTLTLLGFIYTTFVLEIIVSFLAEGVPKAALVIGIIMGFFAIMWSVLLGRFVFAKKTP